MNILLCCSAGMSTSLLVSKMEQSARNQGIDCKIWAIAASEVNNEIEKADVILLGPQVRFLLPQVKKPATKEEFQLQQLIHRTMDYVMVKKC